MLSTVQRITDPPDETKAGSLISVRGNLRRSSIPIVRQQFDRPTIAAKIKKLLKAEGTSVAKIGGVLCLFEREG